MIACGLREKREMLEMGYLATLIALLAHGAVL